MPKAYSADMRERVIARVASGASRREAAEHYEISASTAVIWTKCFHETGRCAAKPRGGSTSPLWTKCFHETGRCAAKPRGGSTSPLEAHADFLLGLIADQSDLTLDEVVSAMRKRRIRGSRTAAWRFFERHRITFKKKPARNGAAARGRGAGAAALDARARHV